MKQSNAFPIALLIGGVLGALYLAYDAMEQFIGGDLAGEQPVLFAIACLVACIGWRELTATNEFNEIE